MIGKRFLRRVMTIGVVTIVGAIAPAIAASAAPPSPYVYQPPTIGKRHGQVVTGLDGSVTIGCAPDGNGEVGTGMDLTTYDKTGKVVRRLSRTAKVDGGVPNCIDSPVVDKAGVLYGIPSGKIDAYNSGHGQLYAYVGNAVRWKYPVACTSGEMSQVAIGGNGNIYVTSRASDGKVHLIGLSPTLRAPSTVPTKVLDISLGNTDCSNHLYPYRDGIVVMGQSSGVHYWSYGGKPLGAGPRGDFWNTRVALDGTLYTQETAVGARHIKAFDPLTGQTAWSYMLPVDTDPIDLTPLPGGGVIARVNGQLMYAPGVPASPPTTIQQLLFINGNGFLMRQVDLPKVDSVGATTYGATYLVTDTTGKVVVTRAAITKAGSTSFQSLDLTVLSVAGQQIDHKSIVGDIQESGQPASLTLDDSPTTTSGAAVVVAHCDNCASTAPKVMPVVVAGLVADYPRAAVLVANTKAQPAPAPYVAMGDSYSSGEGVLPFDDGTDTDTSKCHRSQKAYSYVVSRSRSPWIGASLSGGKFVACSGATTDAVRKDKGVYNGEPPQYARLNPSTKYVTITIGGNDVGFVDFGTACVVGSCSIDSRAYRSIVAQINSVLSYNLTMTYEKILRYAPNATVYVLSYPQIAPVKKSTDKIDPRCSYLYDGGSPWADSRGARDVLERLNAKIKETVSAVRGVRPSNRRLSYLDVNAAGSPFVGHTVCSAIGSSYFNNIDQWIGHPAYAIHPNERGQLAYALLVMRTMSSS